MVVAVVVRLVVGWTVLLVHGRAKVDDCPAVGRGGVSREMQYGGVLVGITNCHVQQLSNKTREKSILEIIHRSFFSLARYLFIPSIVQSTPAVPLLLGSTRPVVT